MENTIYGLFQEAVNKYRNNVAIIENKRTMTFANCLICAEILLRYLEGGADIRQFTRTRSFYK